MVDSFSIFWLGDSIIFYLFDSIILFLFDSIFFYLFDSTFYALVDSIFSLFVWCIHYISFIIDPAHYSTSQIHKDSIQKIKHHHQAYSQKQEQQIMDDMSSDDDDETQRLHRLMEAEVECEQEDETSRNNYAEIRQCEVARRALMTKYDTARMEYHGRREKAVSAGMRNYMHLSAAKEKLILSRSPHSNSSVFAHDLPVMNKASDAIEYAKSYLTGAYSSAFEFCHLTSSYQDGVLLDEMTPTDKPVRLFFDLELKKMKHSTTETDHHETYRYSKGVFKEHIVAAVQFEQNTNPNSELNPSDDLIKKLVAQYLWFARKDFNEAYCQLGYCVMTGFIKEMLKRLIGSDVVGDNDPWEGMFVSTRCRADKFSLHIVMQDIYCDRASRSMPVIVFEIARQFTMMNTLWLLKNEHLWHTNQGIFRMRCLMMESMQNDQGRFKGQSDTIFDEGVYSPGHLFGAPGACKPGSTVPMTPVPPDFLNTEAFRMMPTDTRFFMMFDNSAKGLESWVNHTIAGAGNPSAVATHVSRRPYLISNWSLTGAYIRHDAHRRQTALRAYRENEFRPILNIVCDFRKPRYTEFRRTVVAPLNDEEIILRDQYVNFAGCQRMSIQPDDEYRLRSTKCFQKFSNIQNGELVYHRHDGQIEEEGQASAKVIFTPTRRGVFCYRCQIFYVMEETEGDHLGAKEERYPYTNDDIREADLDSEGRHFPFIADPLNQNNLPWKRWLEKCKFIIVDAPMGSGKTHQLERLAIRQKSDNKSILVITFRVSLAYQMAKRLNMQCYKAPPGQESRSIQSNLDHRIKNNEFHHLVISVNSLGKLGDMTYDTVILDECGLIRRHFLSSIMMKCLGYVWNRFINTIQDAKNVIMCQDFVSLPDVEFYTTLDNIDATNRNEVMAFRFVRPVTIHPIKFSSDFSSSIHQLVRSYEVAFNDEGTCIQPFMVLCTKTHMCAFIVHILTETCNSMELWTDEVKKKNAKRIKGLWRNLVPTSKFAQNFLQNPNSHSSEADVVVVTPIIGAGFSINTHFVAFHAFFFKNVINHWMQQQFLQRLRFILKSIGVDAVRQSFLHCEADTDAEGTGSEDRIALKLIREFNKVRADIIARATSGGSLSDCATGHLEPLAITQGQMVLEDSVSIRKGFSLMEAYGRDELSSTFEPLTLGEDVTEENLKLLKKRCTEFLRTFKSDIGDKVLDTMGIEVDHMENALEELPDRDVREVMIAAGSRQVCDYWDENFISTTVAKRILLDRHKSSCSTTKLKTEARTPGTTATSAQRLACWLVYMYRELDDLEGGNLVMDYYCERRYNTPIMRNCSGMLLAAELLPDIFGGKEKLNCVYSTGHTPFYTGLRIKRFDPSLANYFKRRFAPSNGENNERKLRRHRVLNLLEVPDVTSSKFTSLFDYTEPGNNYPAFAFLQLVCKCVGLKLSSTGKRTNKQEVENHDGKKRAVWFIDLKDHDIAMTFLLNKNFIARLKAILPSMLHGDNLHEVDIERVSCAWDIYNKAVGDVTTADGGVDEITPQKAALLYFQNPLCAQMLDEVVTIQTRIDETALERLALEQRRSAGEYMNDNGEDYSEENRQNTRRLVDEANAAYETTESRMEFITPRGVLDAHDSDESVINSDGDDELEECSNDKEGDISNPYIISEAVESNRNEEESEGEEKEAECNDMGGLVSHETVQDVTTPRRKKARHFSKTSD